MQQQHATDRTGRSQLRERVQGHSRHDGIPAVSVRYQDDPLASVQVSLFAPTGQTPPARAITREDGKAYFTDVPSPEPAQYRFELESLSDGGWMLDPRTIEAYCKKERLEPLESSPVQELTLPDRAVGLLAP